MQKSFFLLLLIFTFVDFAHAATPPEVVPGEYIIQLKDGFALADFQEQAQYGLVMSSIPNLNLLVVKRPPEENAEKALGAIEADPRVEFAEPNFIYYALRTPNDPLFKNQWSMNNTINPSVDLGLTKAWDIQTGSRQVIVAVIDTGINYKHPSLKDNMWVNEAEKNGKPNVDDDHNGFVDDIHGYNFVDRNGDPMDDQMHGSHCAGVIGAKGNDGIDVAGVNWNVRLMALKFLSAKGGGSTSDAIKAIDYAIKMKAQILSNSWGGGPYSRSLNKAIGRANTAGILFVAAAGNDGTNIDIIPTYPASYSQPNIVTVASVGPNGTKSSFSNYGRSVHLAAPGEQILSTVLNSETQRLSGTSMATPHISGIAALVLAQNPKMTALEVKNRLIASAMKLDDLSGVTKYGLVNAFNAVKNVTVTPEPEISDSEVGTN